MKLRPFELALVVIFLVFALLTLVVLANWKGGGNDDEFVIGSVDIWGTLPAEGMNKVLFELGEENEQYRSVRYRSIRSEDFQSELVNALADDKGPDLILLDHERLVELRSKIKPISYDVFSERDIRDKYIDGAAIFALSDGLYAYPVVVDPLVLYWNRDLMAADGIVEPPATWESLVNDHLPKLIRRNVDRSIERSVVALGEYNNVKNSFALFSTLLLQAGSAGVREEDGDSYTLRLNQMIAGSGDPLRISTDFYTRFSKPSNSLYSWNRSYSLDQAQFLGEKLVYYFGYGSEGPELERLNPNLNFDIAEVPQGQAATVRRVYGKFYGFAALRSSNNLPGVSYVLSTLGSGETAKRIADEYHVVPAFRSQISSGSNDKYGRISYKSASVAYGWLNPARPATDSILSTLLQDVNENRQDIGSAIVDALNRLELEYR